MLPILESLAQMEETVVRDEAVKSLKKVANKLDASALLNQFLLMVLSPSLPQFFSNDFRPKDLLAPIFSPAVSQPSPSSQISTPNSVPRRKASDKNSVNFARRTLL